MQRSDLIDPEFLTAIKNANNALGSSFTPEQARELLATFRKPEKIVGKPMRKVKQRKQFWDL
jgi:hypothetical protein